MYFKLRPGSLLRQIRGRLYRGRIQQAIQYLGLNTILSEPYWKLVYLLSAEAQTYAVNEEEVKLRSTTFKEFMRFRTFVGERPVIEDVLNSVGKNDVFFDVGANVGTYTCFVASSIGQNRTLAFEPEPRNAERLRENLKLNDSDTEVIEIALSNTEGTVDFALTGKETGEGEHAIATDDNAETIEVETARGDTVINQHGLPRPTVVKIDVEGAELSVLRGLQETLRESCRLVYVEVHPEKITDFDAEPSEVRIFLTEAGFKVTEIANRGNEVFLRASK